MSTAHDSEPAAISSLWTSSEEGPNQFGHTTALQVALVAMIGVALGVVWVMMQLPFITLRYVLSCIPAVLGAYLIYRLYLSFTRVEFFDDRVEIGPEGKAVAIPYDSIRQIRFDSFSHDLLLGDGTREYRIPRTIQGHRAILHRLHQRVEVERDHSPEMEVHVRLLPRLACGLSITAMVTLCLIIASEMPQVAIALLLFCLPASYMLLDQCVLRDYRFTPDELYVKGFLGTKVYKRSQLKDVWITKSSLSSRFQMTFSNGVVQFDEYLLSKALIQVSGYVERRWQQRVMPLSRRG